MPAMPVPTTAIRSRSVPRMLLHHPCYANRTTIRPPSWITAAAGDPMRPALRKGGHVCFAPAMGDAGGGPGRSRAWPGTDAMTDMPGEISHAALIARDRRRP